MENIWLPLFSAGLTHKSGTASKTAQVKAYIAQNYSKKIQLEELSAVCHLSPCALSRKFRKESGETITHFVTRYRLRMAKHLLVTESLTIKEIAFATGFEDVAYFTKTFREKVGQTPSSYRNGQKTYSTRQENHNGLVKHS